MYLTQRQRHNQAMLAPSRKDEKAIVQILRGLQEYEALMAGGDLDPQRATLAQGMADIAKGLQKLISGPLGRLDAEMLAHELAPFIDESAGNLSLVASDPVETTEARAV